MQLLTCVMSCKYKCLIATHTKWFMRTFISFLQSNILSLTECKEVIFVAIDFYFDLWQFSTLCSLYKHQPTMTSTFRLNTKNYFLLGRSIVVNFYIFCSLSLLYFWKFNNKFYYFVARGQVAEFFMILSHMGKKVQNWNKKIVAKLLFSLPRWCVKCRKFKFEIKKIELLKVMQHE